MSKDPGETALGTPSAAVQQELQPAVIEAPASGSSLLAATAEPAVPGAAPAKAPKGVVASAAEVALAPSSKATDTVTAATEQTHTQLQALPILEAKATTEAGQTGLSLVWPQ